MRNKLKIAISTLILVLYLPALIISAAASTPAKVELRGLWVATVVNIDYPLKPTTDSETLKKQALKILDYAKDTGFNAVFLQVRPAADALYKSKYFPWSKYLTGKQGLKPNNDFDPLEFWVTEAHARGIELHAWMNPYRVTKNTSKDPKYDFASLDPSNPAILNPTWVVKYTDGNLYFNPGLPEVRKLIIDGALEIIENYGVDGIHFDDYFYPGKNFNDKATFTKYGTGFKNIDDWRRANVNALIGDLSNAIKATGKKVSFGISPFGIWANKSANPNGSDTSGMQSYYDHYADTRNWVLEGRVDYLAPQIYWNIGFSVADYSKLLAWWADVVKGTEVNLYIGQAAYRSGNTDPASPWYGVSEIDKQLKLNANTSEVKGSIFFNYKSLYDSPALSAVIKANYEQRDGIVVKTPVGVSRPSQNIKTGYENYYLSGSSDQNKILFLNGKQLETRSKLGYFGILLPLSKGENIFTFSQQGSFISRVIYREDAVSTPKQMSAVEIPSSSAFPQEQEYRMSGEKITLYCRAPIGSTVTVKLGKKSYEMKPATTSPIGTTGIYPTTFSYEYTASSYTGSPRIIDLGAPQYSMDYKGTKVILSAPAKIGVVMENAPFYAKVSKDVIDTYLDPTSSNGAAYELINGMTDYVTGMTGSFLRLSQGEWVKKNEVVTHFSKIQYRPIIKKAYYQTGSRWDVLNLNISSNVAALVAFDGNILTLSIATVSKAAKLKLPANSLFSSLVLTKNHNKAQYSLLLKKNKRIDGYYIEKTSTGLILHIKKHVKTLTGAKPLTGKTIMLDPGHGGSDTGAIGPLLSYPEKTINLQTSMGLKTELEKLGAKVLMTRTTDVAVSLEGRLGDSRNSKPDLYISIHANSMEDNVDISKKEGFSVYYHEALAQPIAQLLLTKAIADLNRKNQGIHNKVFYVTRGTWTPSILIETGFVPNPNEFEWLINKSSQAKLAKSIADAITQYFKV